jgi:hypothetical protein
MRFNPDTAAVMPDDFSANGQSDAGAGIVAAPVQTAEDVENVLVKLRVDSDAVIDDRKALGMAPAKQGATVAAEMPAASCDAWCACG